MRWRNAYSRRWWRRFLSHFLFFPYWLSIRCYCWQVQINALCIRLTVIIHIIANSYWLAHFLFPPLLSLFTTEQSIISISIHHVPYLRSSKQFESHNRLICSLFCNLLLWFTQKTKMICKFVLTVYNDMMSEISSMSFKISILLMAKANTRTTLLLNYF